MASISDPSGSAAPVRSTYRMISAPGEPPGSRVSTARSPASPSRAARNFAWVDFPAPSPPSNVMNRPRIQASRPRRPGWPSYALSTGAEQADHKFCGGVEGALVDCAATHALSRLQRHLQREMLPSPNLQGSDLRALLDRCRNWPGIHNLGRYFFAATSWDQQPDRLFVCERHVALLASEKLRFADRFALGEKQPRLEGTITPLKQFPCLVRAFFQ